MRERKTRVEKGDEEMDIERERKKQSGRGRMCEREIIKEGHKERKSVREKEKL